MFVYVCLCVSVCNFLPTSQWSVFHNVDLYPILSQFGDPGSMPNEIKFVSELTDDTKLITREGKVTCRGRHMGHWWQNIESSIVGIMIFLFSQLSAWQNPSRLRVSDRQAHLERNKPWWMCNPSKYSMKDRNTAMHDFLIATKNSMCGISVCENWLRCQCHSSL